MTEPSRWGFAGLTDAEYDEFITGLAAPVDARQHARPREPVVEADRPPVRVDVAADGAVTVVELASDWRARIEPRTVGAEALRRLHARIAERLLAAAALPATPAAPTSPSTVDLTQWGADLNRLADEARQDARRLRHALHQHRNTSTTVRSADGHAWGLVRGADIVEVETDPHWAATAHRLDIQAELLDILRRLQHAAAPARLTQGPASPAAHAVAELVRDPLALTRAAGLNP